MSAIAFLDFQKAFDTVDHHLLLQKLDRYRIRGNVWSLFQDYLTRRRQFVQIGAHESTSNSLTCGVPQGSVLGPLLFLIYINDLPGACSGSHVCLFADDTSILTDNLTILQNDLNDVNSWLQKNKMVLNVEKSQLLVFGKNPPDVNNTSIDGKRITLCNQAKYLGVYIDDKLNFDYHISTVTKKLAQLNGFIYRGRSVLSSKNLVFHYQNYIKPIV